MADERWNQVKEIFNAALEHPPKERRRFLNRVCHGDAALRKEVESLLSSYNEAESFIESPAAEEVAEEILSSAENLASSKIYGHYEIVRLIGVGGMGEVYLAKDTRLDRQVAVKILNEKYSRHKSNLDRFIREAKAASALNHPNILVIHEIGESDGVHFIVSEFISGKTLREIFNNEHLPITEVLNIAIQIAGALAAAHEAHLVHRDIKPENVMIRPDGYAKVLDFGLAKLVAQKTAGLENPTVRQNQTAKGVILGTVNYMSPEQAKGQKVDERTDIFSFGIVIYEMLAGRTPFVGDSVSETFANLINKETPPLSRFAADVPDELQRIVSKMLRKNKDERYQTMKDLLSDLKTLQKRLEFETEFKQQNLPGTNDKTQELKVEKKDSQPQNSIAVLPFANISGDAENEYFCDGLAEELINALVKIGDLKVAARTSAFSFRNKNAEVGEIGKTLNVKTVLEGSVRKSGNRLRINIQLINASDGFHIWSERYDGEMSDIFDLQDEIVLAVIDKLKVRFLSEEKEAVLKFRTSDPKAYEYYLKGMYYRWKFSPEDFRRSGDYFHRAVDADPTFALAYFGLNSYYGYGTAWGLLNMPPAEGWAKAEAAINKGLEIDPTLPELQLSSAALKLINYRDFDDAGKKIERAAAANSKFPEIHHVYSYYLLLVERFDEAIAEAEQALQLDPLSVNYSSSLGRWLFFARRYDEAVAQFKKSLELDPNNASVHEFLGDVYQEQGKFDEAIAEWHRAMTLEGDDELAAVLKSSYTENGFAAAVNSVARKRIERLNSKIENGEFVLAIHFARAYLALNDKEKAFEWLEKAIEERNVFPLLINVDPFYDALRGDPRFHRLKERIGIPLNQTDNSKNAAKTTGKNGFSDQMESENSANKNSTSENLNRTSPMTDSFNTRKGFYFFGLLFLLAATGFGFYYWFFQNKTSVDKKTLAVLPFVNVSQDPNAEYLSDGVTENLINNLSQFSGLKVISKNSSFRFKDSQSDLKTVASQLGVENLITGDVRQVNDRLVINVRLIDAKDDSQIWGNQYVKTTDDIISAQNEIVRDVARKLETRLTSADEKNLAKKHTENTQAYQLFLKGRFHFEQFAAQDMRKAIAFFQQAINLDPSFAAAYAYLGASYSIVAGANDFPRQDTILKAKENVLKAISLDDHLSTPHEILGYISFQYEYDFAAAEREFKLALEIDPNDSSARESYGAFLTALGKYEEALTELRQAAEINPLSPSISSSIGMTLFSARRYDEAVAQFKKALELDAYFLQTHRGLASTYQMQRNYAESVEERAKSAEIVGNKQDAAFMRESFMKGGWQGFLRAMTEDSQSPKAPPYVKAAMYAELGEKDKAFEILNKLYEERSSSIVYIKTDPLFDNLRDDPRFHDFVHRGGFLQ